MSDARAAAIEKAIDAIEDCFFIDPEWGNFGAELDRDKAREILRGLTRPVDEDEIEEAADLFLNSIPLLTTDGNRRKARKAIRPLLRRRTDEQTDQEAQLGRALGKAREILYRASRNRDSITAEESGIAVKQIDAAKANDGLPPTTVMPPTAEMEEMLKKAGLSHWDDESVASVAVQLINQWFFRAHCAEPPKTVLPPREVLELAADECDRNGMIAVDNEYYCDDVVRIFEDAIREWASRQAGEGGDDGE